MSDQEESDQEENSDSTSLELGRNSKRIQRSYSDDDKYLALSALRVNGNNVYRTAKGLGIPLATLQGWIKQYESAELRLTENPVAKERRGDLAAKLEDKVHSVIESITPEVIEKATLSQRGVFIGIATDKIRILRGQGLDPDPAMELCRLLGLNRKQLPERFELQPGDIIETHVLKPAQNTPEPVKVTSEDSHRGEESATEQADEKLLESINEEESAN